MAAVDVSGAPPILVFGRNGQVAKALSETATARPLIFAGRETCDLTSADPGALIRRVRPIAVINASAYTAVDLAEREPDLAYRLNRDVVEAMARTAAEINIPFVHVSTDYVFDGTKPAPYVEIDPVGPLGVYGASKAAGEAAVAAAGGRWTILRTAWVFSQFGANFIKTMLRLAGERDEVSVVADQWGRPTLGADIAAVALEAASGHSKDKLRGLFHLAGADDAVWADIAERVFEDHRRRTGRRPVLKRISTPEYPTPARRPANSRLDTTKLKRALGWSPRPWRETVDLCLATLTANL